MLPAIAEVVDVSQRLRADVFEHVVEAGLAGVEEVASPMDAGKGGAPSDVTGAKLVEMAVGPLVQPMAAWNTGPWASAPKGFLLCVSEQRVDVGLLGHADNDAVHRTAR